MQLDEQGRTGDLTGGKTNPSLSVCVCVCSSGQKLSILSLNVLVHQAEKT